MGDTMLGGDFLGGFVIKIVAADKVETCFLVGRDVRVLDNSTGADEGDAVIRLLA